MSRGGWAAAWLPNINENNDENSHENSHSSIDGNRRLRSLFAEKLSQDSNLFDTFGTLKVYQTFDLEGIANDGFGYTVVITGPEKGKKMRNKLFKQPSERSLRSAAERQKSLPQTRYGMSESESAIMIPQPPQPTRANSPTLRRERERDGEFPLSQHRSGIEIMEKKEFDLRESYEEGGERNWHVRGHYSSRLKQEEVDADKFHGNEKTAALYEESLTTEDGIPTPNRVLHAWQPVPTDAFGCKVVPSSRAATPLVTNSIAHLQGRDVSPIRTNLATKFVSGNNTMIPLLGNSSTNMPTITRSTIEPARMRSLKTALPRVLHATRMNTPSPPPIGQPPHTKSPVVAPNNSSQSWASSTNSPHRQRLSNLQANNFSDEALIAHMQQRNPQPRPDTLDLAIPSAWREKHSHSSSLAAMDGSRESLVLKLDTISDGDESQGQVSDTGSFDLPVQRPGSRGTLQIVSRPASKRRSNSVKDASTNGRVYSRGNPTGLIPISWIGSRPGTADL